MRPKKASNIEITMLSESILYNKKTGQCTWKKRPLRHFSREWDWKVWNSHFSGSMVGTLKKNKGGKSVYSFSFQGKQWLLHRVIWMIVTGENPKEIDHINGDSSDNRLANLRSVSRSENMKNVRKRERNLPTGIVKRGARFGAQIKSNNTGQIWLGTFDCLSDAIKERKRYERLLGFHKNHGTERAL